MNIKKCNLKHIKNIITIVLSKEKLFNDLEKIEITFFAKFYIKIN